MMAATLVIGKWTLNMPRSNWVTGGIRAYQQKGGRGEEKITHRKNQDDNGGQGHAVCAHAITLFFLNLVRASTGS